VGAALALLIAIAALALAIVAFMSTIRDEKLKPGRLVQTRVNSDYTGGPVLFPVDDFYIGYNSDFDFRAWYVYPPGFYGHMRGCKVVWDSDAVVETGHGPEGPGLYVDSTETANWCPGPPTGDWTGLRRSRGSKA
jgi:hypothetical protein